MNIRRYKLPNVAAKYPMILALDVGQGPPPQFLVFILVKDRIYLGGIGAVACIESFLFINEIMRLFRPGTVPEICQVLMVMISE